MALNPHQRNKVDVSSMSEDEQKLFRLYGKLPTKKDFLQSKLRERKYFDSGDYALQKAGKTSSDSGVPQIGSQHPLPENIPHLTPTTSNSSQNGTSGASGIMGASSGSPVKESSILHRGTSVDDVDSEDGEGKEGVKPEKLEGKPMPLMGVGRQAPGTGLPGIGKVPFLPPGRPIRSPIKSPMSQGSGSSTSPPAVPEGKGIPIRWQS